MSKTFNAPPTDSFDNSRNISQWARYTAHHSPDHPAFAYAEPGSQPCVVTWAEMGAAIDKAASFIDSVFNLATTTSGDSSLPVIGILANLDSITFCLIYLGILQAGGIAFLISTKNSPAAIAHLLKNTGTCRLLVSADNTVQALVSATMDSTSQQGHPVVVKMAPTFQNLFGDGGCKSIRRAGLETPINLPALILHSSGSTSFPKPIILTHHSLLLWTRRQDIVGVDDLPTIKFAIHALPPFHGLGVLSTLWAMVTGVTLTVFPPHSPPMVPSPSTVLESAVASGSSFMLCVPLFIEIWSRDTDAVGHLKAFKGIVFSGGPFNHAIGDELVKLGVSLVGLYGTTETGPSTVMMIRSPQDLEWAWLQLSPKTDSRFIPQDDPDIFEIVFLECATDCPVVFNSTVDGRPAFATNDLVIRHPTDPMKFKILGRKDDQIMLSSGEKTNPGPLEFIIARNPLVANAVMFGRGRDQNGILIQPASEHEFDPADTSKLSQYRNEIWPSVAEANEFAPSHSRIFKEMILVTHPSRPMEMTPKQTLRRGATLEAYKAEIEGAYRAVQDSTQTDIPLPPAWNSTEVLKYVRSVVQKVLEKQIGDESDIFEQGGDSLLATYIRNSFVHVVRVLHKETPTNIPQNFVYDNPTITGLAQQLVASNASPGASSDKISYKLRDMEDMITAFSAHFPTHKPTDSHKPPAGDVILITGTTGGLGSQLLALLASSPEVDRIYAFNRRSHDGRQSLSQRQTRALIERGLDPSILDGQKVILVEGDTARVDLDLEPSLYSEIRDNITLIIHNAWKVHFNLGFASFKQNIRGVRALVDLALRSPLQDPPRLIYLSSVGVFRNWNVEGRGRPMESSLDDPRVVLGNGYGESKYVAEWILENAAASTALRPVIVRIGQMTGTASGVWNSTDWLPAIVRSGQVLGVLPARSDCIAWISLEVAAQSIFDFRNSEALHLHLAHPNPSPWSTVFDVFSSRLGVHLVSWDEWLARLEQSSASLERNPAVHLIEFFRGCAPVSSKDCEALGVPLMDMQQALKASPTLSGVSLPLISAEDAEKWLAHWKAIGFLSEGAI